MWKRVIRAVADPLLLPLAQHMERLREEDKVRRFRSQATVAPNAVVHPPAEIHNYSRDPTAITIGSHTHILGELLVFWRSGRIAIGERSIVARGSRIWSQDSVTIGDHVGISYSVNIHDSNDHPLDWEERRLDYQSILSGKGARTPTTTISAPIVIEDDVWIGFGASVLKGVHIGRGAIVAAGSVVVDDVPEWTVVAGNPARVVKRLVGVAPRAYR